MKKAFTMAEILITLAILGVVATLTLPNLNVNIQKSQCGPALMKAINDIEQANRWILNDRDSKNIRVACDIQDDDTAGDTYLECLIPPLKLDNVGISKDIIYSNKTGDKVDNTPNEDDKGVYGFGGVVIWSPKEAPIAVDFGDGRTTTLVSLFVDSNGIEKGPNTLGRDLFRIYLDTKNNTIVGVEDPQNLGTSENEQERLNICETSGDNCAYLIMRDHGKITYKW